MAEGEKIVRVNIENQMKTAYIDYSMFGYCGACFTGCKGWYETGP